MPRRESDSRGLQATIRNTIDTIDEEIAQDLRTSAAGKCGEWCVTRFICNRPARQTIQLGILLCRLGVAIKFQIFGGKKRTELEADIS
jgi:hypothetical protein